MSLRPSATMAVPPSTAAVAHAAFPKGHPYLLLRDILGPMFTTEPFASLFSTRGRPAECPGRLALVSVLQCAEGLSDRQAADAVRGRIDWKYILGLELTDPGFDSSVLSEFRTRLVAGDAVHQLLDTLLTHCREHGVLRSRGRQRTDSTHVLGAIRAMNRVECVVETFRHALNVLALAAPDWLRAQSEPSWVERYANRPDDQWLPKGEAQRAAYARTVGEDGHRLFARLTSPDAPAWLRELPAVDTLRRVWVQQFYVDAAGRVHWRTAEHGLPPARSFLSSPYDLEAHYARKATTSWIGYKVHLTETCDGGLPHLITHVETTSGPVADGEAMPQIHAALAARHLLPERHIVDTGYLDAALLVASQQDYGVELYGPTRPDYRWQARAETGFDAARFTIAWTEQRATCPAGRTSLSWTPAIDNRKNVVIKIKFSRTDCLPCPLRAGCTRTARRTATVGLEAQYHALQLARERERAPSTARSTRGAPGLRARFRKRSAAAGFGAPAIAGRPRPICTMCSPPRRSMWCGWLSGWRARRWSGRVNQLSPNS